MNPNILIISGPTATGKTKVSIELAQILRKKNREAHILNFDSLLFYKELSIGTAKPTLSEREGIPHHLIDIESIKNPLSASDYIKRALPLIEELLEKRIIPILVGGSGFYLRALIKGMYEGDSTPEEIKHKVQTQYKAEGITPFLELLKNNDSKSFQKLHKNDHYRILRASEFFLTTGKAISEERIRSDENDAYDFLKNAYPHWKMLHFYLDIPKETHLEIIKKRTEDMFEKGLIEEVQNLLKKGYTSDLKPFSSIGYKQVLSLLKNPLKSPQQAVEETIIATRQLAKSQRTFFNKIVPKEKINPLTEKEKIFSYF